MFLPVGNHDGGGGGGGGIQLAAEIEEPSLGSTGGPEDRLSALPDDILHSILLRLLSTAAAARTGVLSRRWRGLWAQLPEIRFPFPSDPAAVGPALAASAAGPALRLLHVACRADADAVAWLRTAAGRLVADGEVYFYNRTPGEEREHAGALSWQCQDHTFELPCFETAARVWLRLGFVDLELPLTGVFARLTELRLEHVNLDCEFELGDMVSSPRCPALRELRIASTRGVASLCIISLTLERLELDMLHGLEELTVNAPMLRALNVQACFVSRKRKPVAAIYASRLELLWWGDAFDPSLVVFSEMANLQQLTTFTFPVYGRFDFALLQDYVMLLQHFSVLSQLDLKLNYERDLTQYEYLMGIITRLPNVEILSLWLCTNGHSIGASVCHLLSICPGIRKLKVTLLDKKVDTPCTSACACGQQQNWSTSYSLGFLEEVEIRNFRGSEHDFAFVDRLFGMSTAIKKMAITFHHMASPSELQCTLDILGTCFEVKYNTREVMYERPSSLFPETPDDHCV